jgi:hypothetical protein
LPVFSLPLLHLALLLQSAISATSLLSPLIHMYCPPFKRLLCTNILDHDRFDNFHFLGDILPCPSAPSSISGSTTTGCVWKKKHTAAHDTQPTAFQPEALHPRASGDVCTAFCTLAFSHPSEGLRLHLQCTTIELALAKCNGCIGIEHELLVSLLLLPLRLLLLFFHPLPLLLLLLLLRLHLFLFQVLLILAANIIRNHNTCEVQLLRHTSLHRREQLL